MAGKQCPLLVILGPTATGKTHVAVETALLTGGEVVSADSMLIYKFMDIGTAKPTPEERKGVVHHLIDVIEPDQEFSVAHYQERARAVIEDIHRRGKLPIMTGGTGLYIQSVVDGYQFGEVGIDYDLRDELKQYAYRCGKEALHKRLEQVDPATAARLHPNDQKRVIRALEIYKKTGRPMSSFNVKQQKGSFYNTYLFGLYMPREELYDRINRRVDKMLREGLVDEVKKLLELGYDTDLVSMQGLGYKEIAAYLKGKIDFKEAVYLIKRDTRRFAKRQLTWFRRDARIKWINVKDYPGAPEIAREIIRQAEGVIDSVSNQ